MQFLIIAHDGRDNEALNRRLRVRDEHIALGNDMVRSGQALFGVAILDEDGEMIGSMTVVEFPSRAELDEYLKMEPYVVGDVWQEITVLPCRVGPSYAARVSITSESTI